MPRITNYTPDMIEKVSEYISSCTDKISEFHKTRGASSDTYDRLVEVHVPTLEGLARVLKTTRTTIINWCGTYPAFATEIEALLDEQRDKLIQNGLSGNYSNTITRQLLSGLHNIRDGADLTTNGKDLNINLVDYSKALPPTIPDANHPTP